MNSQPVWRRALMILPWSDSKSLKRRKKELWSRLAIRALAVIDPAAASRKLMAAKATALQRAARHHEALDAWRELAEQEPSAPDGWAGMARALDAMGRRTEIEPLIDAYLEVLGTRPERFLSAARVAMAGRLRPLLAELLTRAEAAARDDPAALRRLANLHVKAGQIGQALNLLDDARRLASENRRYRKRRQRVLEMLRVVGVQTDGLGEEERAGLRMPELAFLGVFKRAGGPASTRPHHLVMVCASLGPGGVQRQLLNTARGLHACGSPHRITLTPLTDDDPSLHRFHAATFATLPVTMQPCAGGAIDRSRLRRVLGPDADELFALLPSGLRGSIGALATRFLEDPPEIVHAWGDRANIAAGVAAAIAGVPRVILSDRSVAPEGSRAVPDYFRAVYTAFAARPGTVLVNNSVQGARSYAEWLDIDAGRIRVIYNGVDIAGLERARDPNATAGHRRRLGLPDDAPVVGALFRLSREKRPFLWLDSAAAVMRQHPSTHFIILGEGPMRGDMEAAARRLGIAERLHMPGAVHDVVPWYDLMDVVVLTSMYEGTSNAALEAQALGKPVVSTAVGGMPETFVPDASGFLVDPDPAPEIIADQVLRALIDERWRVRARATAKAFIRERFSIERMVRDTVEVYGLDQRHRVDPTDPGSARRLSALNG